MKHLRFFTILLVFFSVAAMLLVPFRTSSSPTQPDYAPVHSTKEWMNEWRVLNMFPAKDKVNNAYNNFSGLVEDYKSSINSGLDVVFSAVSNAVQTSWVGMVVGVYNTTKEDAMKRAKTQTLQSAVEEAADDHSTYLLFYNELYDGNVSVDRHSVRTQIQSEIDEHGGILLTAQTMMEAFYKYEVLVENYNKQVDAWNAYKGTSLSHAFATVPSRADFSTFDCFGGCGYQHDTLKQARDDNLVKCGTAANIDELRDAVDAIMQGHRRAQESYALNSAFAKRSVDDGCGRSYYWCNPEQAWQHEKHTHPDSGVEYRNCLSHTRRDANRANNDDDSASAPASPGLYAEGTPTIEINDEEMVSAAPGDTVSVEVVMPSDKGYSEIYWYLASPGESGYGSNQGKTISSNSAIDTSVTYSIDLSEDAQGGVYVFTAYIYPHSTSSDGEVYGFSIKIYVS